MTISMQLDHDLYIRSLSDNWYHESLGAKHSIVGRNLMEFVGGSLVQNFVSSQIEKAIYTGKPIFDTYRCDDNRVRREYIVKIQAKRNDTIQITHRPIWSERMREKIYDKTLTYVDLSIKKCSFCCHYQWQGRWLDTADLLAENSEINVNYYQNSLCPVCLEKIKREIKQTNDMQPLTYQAVG